MNALSLLLAAHLLSAEPGSCDNICERKAAEESLARKDLSGARERLREAISRYPTDPVLSLLLARSYLLEGNLFWAERTLRERLEKAPEDLEARQWLAGILLRQGDPELARESVSLEGTAPEGPLASRQALLRAFLAELSGESEKAGELLTPLGKKTPLFAEDVDVWRLLQRQLNPWWMDPLSGDVEIAGGYTSNALAGSPTDPSVSGSGSLFGDGNLRVRIAPRLTSTFRPVLDLEADGHGLAEEEYRELSSLEMAARPGALFAFGNYRVLLGYRAEVLFLNQTPSRYSDAQRGEIEMESQRGWLLFGGGGRREYRDDARTRSEWDAGAGGPVKLIPGTSMVLGATIRGASAHAEAYDLRGASLALALRVPVSSRLVIRLSALGSWDDYPHSGGREGERYFGTAEERKDLLGKLTLGIWLSGTKGLRAGLEGQVSRRDSTADDRPGFNFDYTEARARFVVRYSFGANPGVPKAVTPENHIPFEWGLSPGDRSEAERIIELLRQDDDLRRGSSCGL